MAGPCHLQLEEGGGWGGTPTGWLGRIRIAAVCVHTHARAYVLVICVCTGLCVCKCVYAYTMCSCPSKHTGLGVCTHEAHTHMRVYTHHETALCACARIHVYTCAHETHASQRFSVYVAEHACTCLYTREGLYPRNGTPTGRCLAQTPHFSSETGGCVLGFSEDRLALRWVLSSLISAATRRGSGLPRSRCRGAAAHGRRRRWGQGDRTRSEHAARTWPPAGL